MIDKDIALIKNFSERIDRYKIVLNSNGDDQNISLRKFCLKLSELLPQIEIENKANEYYSSISIYPNIEYLAVPSGKELSIFMDEIVLLNKKDRIVPEKLEKIIKKIKEPVIIDLYISNFCHVCPDTVKKMLPSASFSSFIKVRVIDTELFPDIAQKNNIMSVPTVIVDDLRWTGELKFAEILDFILNIPPKEMSSESLSRMLKDGEASKVADYMLEEGFIFQSFMELLINDKWSIRLGAIVVIEDIAERSPDIAKMVLPYLFDNFYDMIDQVKGDILYVVGKAGTREMLPELYKILEKVENEELISTAEEAIEEIENNYSLN
ncbi:MAG: hypothetical protein GY714_11010 [Desulfobacterales bacterium]|nr:hypothetical protein [Desulfobacterales bacterium]MCP4161288.1 hypothetical protein [Deltaproteobacteria bacterium]